MKFVIGVLALLLAIGGASAVVDIWGNAYLYGTSQFSQLVQNGGPNWQRVGDVSTGAWITPTTNAVDMQFSNMVQNTGLTTVDKFVETNGDWNVRGIDNIGILPTASTTGIIQKSLVFDTNTKSVLPSGLLESPTNMLAIDTISNDHVNTYQQAINVALNLPPAQVMNSFDFTAATTQATSVNEIFAKKMPAIKDIPTMPTLNFVIDP